MSRRVMIVDDALFMRNLLKDIFVRAGYQVVGEADSGETALAIYQQTRPELVTMDIVMPDKSGLETVRDILAADPEACILMISALGQDMLLAEAIVAGAKDFIIKPFKEEQVLDIAKRLLEEA
ncbi:MAG: response regulator [Desulfuromonadales bacterium]|jgi:two-component system, chemotaxis family, chemotaxis protein CheY